MPAALNVSFTDPDLPDGFTPYNIQNLNGELYVAYENGADREHGGVVDVFDTDGNFSRCIAAGDLLNAPWGWLSRRTALALSAAPCWWGTSG